MNVRRIIREELQKVFEADYYDNFPDFLDPQYNPQIGAYPPVAITNYGDMMKEGDISSKVRKIKSLTTGEGVFSVYDIDDDHRRGDMFTVHEHPDGFIIRNVLIPDEMRRQGIASDVYKKINKDSLKKTGKPLRSTRPRTLPSGEVVHELSSNGIALWDSLVRRGLAIKLGEKDYVFKT